VAAEYAPFSFSDDGNFVVGTPEVFTTLSHEINANLCLQLSFYVQPLVDRFQIGLCH
jgi:hypothetical protein